MAPEILVAAFCAVGVAVAGVVAIAIPSRYTSEVVVQAKFPRQDLARRSEVYVDATEEINPN